MSAQHSYFVVLGICSLFFLLHKRNLDLFTIAFASCLLYFMPTFFGSVMNPNDYLAKEPLVTKCYQTYSYVLISLTSFAFLNDQFVLKKPKRYSIVLDPNITLSIGAIICYLGLVITVYKYGDYFFDDKNALLDAQKANTDRWGLFWAYGEVFLIAFSFIFKKRFFLLLGVFALAIDFYYGGHRSRAAFVLMIYIIYSFRDTEKIRLLTYLSSGRKIFWSLLIIFLGAFFFIFKVSVNLLKQGRADDLWNLMIKDTDFLANAFILSEPSIVQSNLNETFRREIKTDFIHWIDVVDATFSITRFLGLESKANYLNQEELFPNIEWGTSNNPWAFYWSSGGDILLFSYIVFFGLFLMLGNFLIRTSDGIINIFWTFFFIVFAFFSHRNDLFFQIVMQKRVVIFFLIIVIGTITTKRFFSTKFN